jgi:hypothetical protein
LEDVFPSLILCTLYLDYALVNPPDKRLDYVEKKLLAFIYLFLKSAATTRNIKRVVAFMA